MRIEVLKITLTFMVDLFSGHLPPIYYTWAGLLLIFSFAQSTALYYFLKKDERFVFFMFEWLLGFGVILILGIGLSKFLSYFNGGYHK